MANWQIECKDVMTWCKEYEGEPFSAMICDPPYHLTTITKRFGKANAAPAQYGRDGAFQRVSKGFMGSTWDGETNGVGIAFDPATWAALSEHLLPGAFIFVFGSSRGWHRLAVAIEDAGFVFHPSLMVWGALQGQGFPKSTRVTHNDTQLDNLSEKLYNEVWQSINSRNASIAEKLSLKSLIEAGLLTSSNASVAKDVVDYIRQSAPFLSVNIAASDSAEKVAISGNTFIVAESAIPNPGAVCSSVTTVALNLSEDGQPPKEIKITSVPVSVRIGLCDGVTMMVMVEGAQRIELGEVQLSPRMELDALCAEALKGLRLIISNQLEIILNSGMKSPTEPPSATSVIITESMVANLISSMADTIKNSWQGHRYGRQALKPAVEMIICAQKPYEGKPVDSIVETGAGALFIDGGRVQSVVLDSERRTSVPAPGIWGHGKKHPQTEGEQRHNSAGRWPPNFILLHSPGCQRAGTKRVKTAQASNKQPKPQWADGQSGFKPIMPFDYADPDGLETVPAWACSEECAARRIGEQSGKREVSGTAKLGKENKAGRAIFGSCDEGYKSKMPNDTGTAARFFPQFDWAAEVAERLANSDQVFYASKASRGEREAGLSEGFQMGEPPGSKRSKPAPGRKKALGEPRRNHHPCVKNIALCRWLATLLLPPPEYAPRRILIPFSGVSSEGIGATFAGFDEIVMIEQDAEYCKIGEARMQFWSQFNSYEEAMEATQNIQRSHRKQDAQAQSGQLKLTL